VRAHARAKRTSRQRAPRGLGPCAGTLLLGAAACLIAPGGAGASVAEPPPAITRQARAANAAFLAYAPAPGSGPAAICLVDTGVDANPNTANVVYRTSVVEGGPEDVSPARHGTLMAMFASSPGPVEGRGMVGFWPQLKVVSIRAAPAAPPGREVTVSDYVPGAEACMKYAATYHIVAINLSLGSTQQFTASEQAMLENLIQEAHDFGISIVAAAGNEGEAQIDWPARATGIMAVGAFNSFSGAMCSFSDTGPELAILAPGCQLDYADPATLEAACCDYGTSQSTVIVSATLAALRSYDPSLTWEGAQKALTSTASGGDLDVAAAFDSVGLGAIVAAGEANEPKPSPMSAGTSSSTSTTTTSGASGGGRSTTPAERHRRHRRRPAPPRVRRVRWRRGVLRLLLARLPHGAKVRAVIVYGNWRTRRLTFRRRRLVVHIARPLRVELRTIVRGMVSRPRVVLRF
jgi:hypothetical protein